MEFTKIQGCGNDYLFVDLTKGRDLPDAPGCARRISDRRFGVGADGLILIVDSEDPAAADIGMVMYNADGSRGRMCGNGFRGLCKYAYERGLVRRPAIRVKTDSGVLTGTLHFEGDRVERVTVDLGVPDLNRSSLPMEGPAGPAIESRVKAAGREVVGTAVSVGNPHFVVFVDGDPEQYPVEQVGPALETHSLFPERVNAEFVQVLGAHEARQRTWERGSGETLACGTGAAAVCVAGVVTGRLQSPVTIHLRGGDLLLEWAGKGKPVLKTGPTVEVFRGEYPWPQPK